MDKEGRKRGKEGRKRGRGEGEVGKKIWKVIDASNDRPDRENDSWKN